MSPTTPTTPPPTHNATTVLVLREVGELEAFLVKRTSKSSFMASAYVYPGGRLEPDDASEGLLGRVTGRTPAQCSEVLGVADQVVATSFFIAGIRESFEEAGVLIAHRSDDATRALLDLSDKDSAEVFTEWRRRIHAAECTFAEMVDAEGLCFPLERLHPFAHWITPEFERKRFDTWFFLTLAPVNQTLTHDELETVASEWIAPKAALVRHQEGGLHLFPPTFRTLEELAQCDSWEAVLAYSARVPKPPIKPAFETIDGDLVAILPGDVRYPDAAIEPVLGSTRIALREGHWRSI